MIAYRKIKRSFGCIVLKYVYSFFVYNPVFTLHLILSLCYHIQAELGSAEEQPNKE